MKPKSYNRFHQSKLIAMIWFIAGATLPHTAHALDLTWTGGGADGNWSTVENWLDEIQPVATGDTLTFAGTTNLSTINDVVTSLAPNSITFASGAGSFTLSGDAITLGSGGNDLIITQASENDQTIALDLNLAGGGRDRQIVMSGSGSLTLSGNINFSNDWLFPTTSAGTIILSGNNSGDGRGGTLTSGTNTMRTMMRNNVGGTTLVLGSDTALGNSGSGSIGDGTANLRGVVANQNMTIGTTGGSRNLGGSSIIINTANVTFNSTDNLTLGNIINQNGNRDFWATGSGSLTVQIGIALSHDQTGRNLYVNLTGSGDVMVNGAVYDTFHSDGITTGQGTFRKAGTGTMALNGDSSYAALTTIEGGTLKLGHANALGATGSGSGTTLTGNATLDLNGFTTGESITINNNGNQLVNSSATAASISADAALNAPLTVNATGDITATRLIGNAIRTVTKLGAGTLTTNGSSHNNLTAWDIQAGTVIFANTSGFGADRGVTLNGGTLKLDGVNANLINDNEVFVVNSGTFDLNGKNEAIASINGSGGTIRNDAAATTSTLFVGGGPSGTSSASYSGAIENGNGILNLTKEGTGTQTLTGTLSFSGDTTVVNGTLSIGSASLNDASDVSIALGAVLDLTHSDTDVVAELFLDGTAQGPGIYDSATPGGFITGSGKIQVLASGSGFTDWADANGASGQTPDQDHDGDGVDNGVEFFMGETGSSFTANPSLDGTSTITWPKDAGFSGTYRVETSTDLVTWLDVTGSATDDGTSVSYTLTGADKRFVRLAVTSN